MKILLMGTPPWELSAQWTSAVRFICRDEPKDVGLMVNLTQDSQGSECKPRKLQGDKCRWGNQCQVRKQMRHGDDQIKQGQFSSLWPVLRQILDTIKKKKKCTHISIAPSWSHEEHFSRHIFWKLYIGLFFSPGNYEGGIHSQKLFLPDLS